MRRRVLSAKEIQTAPLAAPEVTFSLARLVLGWETAWEHWVLLASFDFCILFLPFLPSGVIRKGSPSIKV